jgi:hypothetical protein
MLGCFDLHGRKEQHMDTFIALAWLSLSNLYMDAGIVVQDRGSAEIRQVPLEVPVAGITLHTQAVTDTANNPYGRFSIGYGVNLGSVSLALEGSHLSGLSSKSDRGVNALELRMRWYPFR